MKTTIIILLLGLIAYAMLTMEHRSAQHAGEMSLMERAVVGASEAAETVPAVPAKLERRVRSWVPVLKGLVVLLLGAIGYAAAKVFWEDYKETKKSDELFEEYVRKAQEMPRK